MTLAFISGKTHPMRNSNVPDILGQFIDPMGGRTTYTQGIDPTNTGA
ncbi:hypothetical protein INT45_001925 [Circinella minor]|uniref:Uncharacterized protein n=1 Tax=Circinella minor TaxID=1195481 RepID=A0A8H7VI51_9FUNG|nr:hypothetical protein INT45_001925 [Circinella minor]